MGRFVHPCKPERAGREHFDVDDAFSAHLRLPLTGHGARWKLSSLL
jgi:hypothetical protein